MLQTIIAQELHRQAIVVVDQIRRISYLLGWSERENPDSLFS